ncbi:MAG: hypothetical protein ACPGNV_14330 [Mangrovicoccus sp.]
MISNWVLIVALICIVACSWNLAQQNVIGKEPFARLIGLSYGVISVGAMGWLVSPVLPIDIHPLTVLAAGFAINLVLITIRLNRLYEGPSQTLD